MDLAKEDVLFIFHAIFLFCIIDLPVMAKYHDLEHNDLEYCDLDYHVAGFGFATYFYAMRPKPKDIGLYHAGRKDVQTKDFSGFGRVRHGALSVRGWGCMAICGQLPSRFSERSALFIIRCIGIRCKGQSAVY